MNILNSFGEIVLKNVETTELLQNHNYSCRTITEPFWNHCRTSQITCRNIHKILDSHKVTDRSHRCHADTNYEIRRIVIFFVSISCFDFWVSLRSMSLRYQNNQNSTWKTVKWTTHLTAVFWNKIIENCHNCQNLS